MPDVFGLETSSALTSEAKTNIAPIEFDPVKFDAEVKASEEKWDKWVHDRRQKLFDEFFELQKKRGEDVSYISPHDDTIKQVDYDPNLKLRNIYSLERDRDFRQRKLLNDWNTFYQRKQRERFRALSPEAQNIEIANGGVNDQNLSLLSFIDGITEGYSLGLVKSKHPIYGERYKEIHRTANSYGSMAGSILNFMALSKVASIFKIPELIKGAKSLRPITKILGAPKFLLGKIGRLKFGFQTLTGMARKGIVKVPVKYLTDQAMRYGTIEAAGAMGLTNGLIGMFAEGIRNTAKRFRHEDNMSRKEWVRSLPRALGEGFLQKYFIGLINDPASWSARFLGDGVYSSGQQLYRIVTGQQEDWNAGDFWRSFIEGHILGEVQGLIFRPNRRQLSAMHANNKLMWYANKLKEKWGGDDSDHFWSANVLWQSELQNAYDKKQFYTTKERQFAVDKMNEIIKPGFTLYRLQDADQYKISPEVFSKITDQIENRSYNMAARYFGLNKSQAKTFRETGALGDAKKLTDTLAKMGKFQKVRETKAKPENINEAIKGITPMNIDDMMDNVETYIRKGFKKDVDVLNFFQRRGEKVEQFVDKTKPKDIESTIRKEDSVELIMEWLYKRGGARALNKSLLGTTITDPEDIIADALEAFWKMPADVFDKMDNPVNYFYGIVKNKTRDYLKKAGKKVGIKDIGDQLENIALKEFEIQRRSDRYSNAIYRVYDTYARKNKTNLKRFLVYYLRSIQNSIPETMRKMEAMGIPVGSENAIAKLTQMARNDLEKIILNREAREDIKVKQAYSRAEAAEIISRMKEEGTRANPVTGARKDIGSSAMNNIKENGGYVISFTSLYNEILSRYGKDTADKVIWKAHDVIEKEIVDINKEYTRQRAGIDIRNPVENNSTKFVLLQKGLEADEFRDAVQQINTVLKQNYNDMAETEKRFAVTVDKPDGTGDVISSFDNVSVTFFKNLQRVYENTDKFESLKDISRIINPIANSILNNSYYNAGDKNINNIINRVEKIVDLRPKTDREWTTLLEEMERSGPGRVERIAGELEQLSRTTDIMLPRVTPQRAVENRNNVRLADAIKADDLRREKQTAVVDKKNVIDTMISQDIKDLFFLDMAKGMERVKSGLKEFRGSLHRAITEKLTVLENLEQRGEPAQRAMITLYKLANTANKGDYNAETMLRQIFQDFNGDVLAGGGVGGQRAMMAFSKLGQWQREEEFKHIIDPETGRIKINANKELYKPIKFSKKTEHLADTLESLKDRPQDIGPELIFEILKSVKDPLVISKILVQNYDITPDQLIGIMTRLERDWYKPLAGWTVNAEDKNFDYFSNMKDNLEKTIRKAIRFNVGEIKKDATGNAVHNIDKLDFNVNGKEAIEAFVREIPDEDMRGRVLKALDWYYDLDPDNLTYVHHQVLANNEGRFVNMISDFINSRTPRGEKVADPFMEALLSKRKMPTLRSLIEAGYKIEENYLNVLNGTFRYAYTKRVNEVIAEEWKTSYLKGFIQAHTRAEETGNPDILIRWFEDHTGYFYMPSKSEIAVKQKRLDEIDTRLKVIEDKTDPTYTALQRERADIQERLELMDTLLKTYAGENRDKIATAVLSDEQFIPGNFSSFIHDKGDKGKDAMLAGVRTQVENMRAADLTNYDGLYFNRVLWKGLRSHVFKNDGLSKEYRYSFVNTIRNFYDKTNRFLKIIRFYKPTIMMLNDLSQAGLANPAFVKYLPWAYKAYTNKNERDASGKLTERAKFFQDMEEMNLFNRGVSLEPLLNNGARAVANIMGRGGILGKIRDDIGLEKSIYKKTAVGLRDFWRAQQGVTWGIDGIIRLATARAMYERFKGMYDPQRAKFMAAEWANLFLVKYSRMPSATRQVLNRFGFVLTYRLQTLRMYKEMMKMFGRGLARLVRPGKGTPMFRASDDQKRQALFEMQPFLRKIVMTGAIKGLLFSLLGFGYDNPWDAITGYRGKRRKGEDLLNTEFQFLSMGTPLFAIEKHLTRISRAPIVFLKYNMAAFPGLLYSLASNSNIITGEKIVEADWNKQPRKAAAQLAMSMLTTYFPWAGDVSRFSAKDVGLAEGLISFFGLGYYYNYKSPQLLLKQFRDAIDKSKDFSEHKRAIKQFQFSLRRAYKTLFNKEYKELADRLEEARSQIEGGRL